MDQTDIDLNTGKVDFLLSTPRDIDPGEIVEKGIVGTVTVDRMILETQGRLVEERGTWYLQVWKSNQLIRVEGSPPETLQGEKDDSSIHMELLGWRDNENFSASNLKKL